ncbi:MAG TPA: BTAD domain-containing putative transcriptional regulator [Gemmatimonadaceae bacterium]|nr:BTAD domain-containing putative transcriptional regulator [Gemmatimonadaceae bacterium]
MPALVDDEHDALVPLRQKDLALLVYLRMEPHREHARSSLASLLWSECDEHRARHSLSQALGRIREALGDTALAVGRETVHWRGALPCDAAQLEDGDPTTVDAELRLYAGDFVVGLALGDGAAAFDEWADARRAFLRRRAAQLLDSSAAECERLGRHGMALQLASRLIEIEPLSESAHRRLMRAWAALGERAMALRHYHQLQRNLRKEEGLEPDPATQALAAELRGAWADPPESKALATTGSHRRQR